MIFNLLCIDPEQGLQSQIDSEEEKDEAAEGRLSVQEER